MTVSTRRYLLLGLGSAAGLILAALIVVVIEYFGSAFVSHRSPRDTAGPATIGAPSADAGGTMSLHDAPRALPEIRFQDGNGKALTLADFRGRTVLLNIWATWCLPCRREMPTLDRV